MDEKIKELIRERNKKRWQRCHCGKTAIYIECKIGEVKLFPVCDNHIINRKEKEKPNGEEIVIQK